MFYVWSFLVHHDVTVKLWVPIWSSFWLLLLSSPLSLSVAFIFIRLYCGWTAIKWTLLNNLRSAWIRPSYSVANPVFPSLFCFFLKFSVHRQGWVSEWWVVALFWLLWELTSNKLAAWLDSVVIWMPHHRHLHQKYVFRIISVFSQRVLTR